MHMHSKPKIKPRSYWKLEGFPLRYRNFCFGFFGKSMPSTDFYFPIVVSIIFLSNFISSIFPMHHGTVSLKECICITDFTSCIISWDVYCFQCALIFYFFAYKSVTVSPMIWIDLFSTNHFVFIKLQGKEFLWILSNIDNVQWSTLPGLT